MSGSHYLGTDGNVHYASDTILPGITVAAAWASLRRCWRGFKIAKAHSDEEKMRLFARRIMQLEVLLQIKINNFEELRLEYFQEDQHVPL